MSSNIINIQPLGFPWQTLDPFIFCVHHRDEFPKGNKDLGPLASLEGRNIGSDFTIKDGWRMYHGKKVPGFPYHPHRGFETITVVKEGFVDHTDSMGACARFSEGDTQWMTAGKGILHSEMFPLLNEEKENPMELFQIWLNLPKVSKFVPPHFKMLWKENTPIFKSKDEKTEVNIIAGNIYNTKAPNPTPNPTPNSWAANPENEVGVLTIKINAGGTHKIPASKGLINRCIYFYRGDNITLDNKKITPFHSIQVNSLSEINLTAGEKDCYLLLLQGKPINEPKVQHGPFVMNTQEEIQEAFIDYQNTHFGGWNWPNHEQTHPKEKGRFAIHSDGKEEFKD